MTRVRTIGSAFVWIGFAALVSCAVIVGLALAAGYRPVVITSGSMGDAAPTGSVIIAAPADGVAIGDVLVMRRDGLATITHRVVEVEQQAGVRYAVTQGDANTDRDLERYRLGEEELVARWTIPHLGSVIAAVNDPWVRFAMVAIVMIILVGAALDRIWVGPRSVSSTS